MIEDYNYKNREEKIQCDISILYGNNDDITQKEILSWQFHSNKKFNIYDFDGDHFFLNDNVEDIIKIINKSLAV